MNCKSCNAPLKSNICSYCGTYQKDSWNDIEGTGVGSVCGIIDSPEEDNYAFYNVYDHGCKLRKYVRII
jgi:hypothetical protein